MAALAAAVANSEGLEQRNVDEARHQLDWLKWNATICGELECLKVAGMWMIIDKPNRVDMVGSKWIFKVKKYAVGHIKCYHAWLVA